MILPMGTLHEWAKSDFSANGATRSVWRRGSGPGVIVIHELPGITPEVIDFADEVVDDDFTVVMPHLFGTPEAPLGLRSMAKAVPQVCISREFTMFTLGRTSPITTWLRRLAQSLHGELGGPGVGAIGMCFTGGFALGMMVDPSVAAPVVAQPSLPLAIGRRRRGDLNLSSRDLEAVRARAAAGCPVLGIQYEDDKATGHRFERLAAEIGSAFIRIDLPGKGHATLTAHRQQAAVDAALQFLNGQLR
jgi:dienelactone hydrolase